jgi:hypothetical protein
MSVGHGRRLVDPCSIAVAQRQMEEVWFVFAPPRVAADAMLSVRLLRVAIDNGQTR